MYPFISFFLFEKSKEKERVISVLKNDDMSTERIIAGISKAACGKRDKKAVFAGISVKTTLPVAIRKLKER